MILRFILLTALSRLHASLPHIPYLDLDWPAEVCHVNIEGDVVVKAEVEFLTREAVVVLFDAGPCCNWHLFSRDGPSCEKEGKQMQHNQV